MNISRLAGRLLSRLMLLSLLLRGLRPPVKFIAWEHVALLLLGGHLWMAYAIHKKTPASWYARRWSHCPSVSLGVPNSVENNRFESRDDGLGPSWGDELRYITVAGSWLCLRYLSTPGWSSEHSPALHVFRSSPTRKDFCKDLCSRKASSGGALELRQTGMRK